MNNAAVRILRFIDMDNGHCPYINSIEMKSGGICDLMQQTTTTTTPDGHGSGAAFVARCFATAPLTDTQLWLQYNANTDTQ